MDSITSFHGYYRFLSNFYSCNVEYNGNIYPSVEHAFQAAKSVNPIEQTKIRLSKTPGIAKSLGRAVKLISNWDQLKLDIMENLVRQKFKDPILRYNLQFTKPAYLVEGNTWNDTYWGQCPLGNGENHLGKLLMKIRDEI